MKKYTLLLIYILFIALSLNQSILAQNGEYDAEAEQKLSEYNPRFSLFLNYGVQLHSTNFNTLTDKTALHQFVYSGVGAGLNFGAAIQIKMNDYFNIGLKLFSDNLNGRMLYKESVPVTIAGELQTITIENKIESAINNLVLSPYIAVPLTLVNELKHNLLDEKWADFNFGFGLLLGYNLSSDFTQYEELIAPQGASFENGRTIRAYEHGDLVNYEILQFGFNAFVSYDYPLNKEQNIRLKPEIGYSFWHNTPYDWNVNKFTAGVAIEYNAPPLPPPPPKDPIIPPLPPLNPPEFKNDLVADINYRILDSNNVEQVSLSVEEFASTSLKPLLNYVFFEDGAYQIPTRYHLLSADETKNFSYRTLQGYSVLQTYYEVLNIIALRLKQEPNATIEIVGNNCNKGIEQGNTMLSQARADAVRKYFTDVWNIEGYRIKTTARNLPKEPTRPVDGNGDEENRRVEIYSNTSTITDAFFNEDTIQVVQAAKLQLLPFAHSAFGIKRTSLEVTNSNVVFSKQWQGFADSVVECKIDTRALVSGIDTIHCSLSVQDNVGYSKTAHTNIKVDRVTIKEKRSNAEIKDVEYDYYSLILFDYASSKLAAKHNKVIDFIKTRIKPTSTVVVSGYTDALGNDDVNRRIATERATSVAKKLKTTNVTIRGIGKDAPLLYDNTYPEGRFYCRTVTIEIETPITNE